MALHEMRAAPFFMFLKIRIKLFPDPSDHTPVTWCSLTFMADLRNLFQIFFKYQRYSFIIALQTIKNSVISHTFHIDARYLKRGDFYGCIIYCRG